MEKQNKDSKPNFGEQYEEMIKASRISPIVADDVVDFITTVLEDFDRNFALYSAMDEAEHEAKVEIARRMKNNGFSNQDIKIATNLPEWQLREL